MRSNNIPPIVRWWVTPKLPIDHIIIPLEKRPKGIHQIFRVYIRKWLIHPIKRRLAKYYLIFLKNFFGIKVIGITGSAGKTTTKEMLTAILANKGKTVSSLTNIDPIYNIPTTILKCTPSTKYLVLEMGVEFPGEMDFYLWLGKPDVGIITNIYPTHTLYFGDEKGVAKEKGKLLKALNKSDYAVLNSESAFTRALLGQIKAKVILFGKGGEIKAEKISYTREMNTEFMLVTPKGKIKVRLPILGKQFAKDSVAAASGAFALGASLREIKKGLETFKTPRHRMTPIHLRSGAIILDDSYNNNPEAAKEALEVLEEVSKNKKKVIVFGDMLELGRWERKYHLELGENIGKRDISKLICVGGPSHLTAQKASKMLGQDRVISVSRWQEALPYLRPVLKKGTFVLVKGSRSTGLDQLVKELS